MYLNSRILWFFSNAYETLDDSEVNRDELKKMADHAYEFLVKDCLDKDNGGVFWSLNYDGTEKTQPNIHIIRLLQYMLYPLITE